MVESNAFEIRVGLIIPTSIMLYLQQSKIVFLSTRARAAYILASELLEEPRLDLPFGEKESYKNENEAVKILKQILLDESEHRLKIHPNIFHRFSYT